MNLNFQDNQAEKSKTTTSLTKASPLTSDQLEATKKAKEKVKKKKKKRGHQGKQDRREKQDDSSVAIRTNAI